MPASKDVIENPIAYEIKDKNFGVFKVKNSANAWWLGQGKVEALIEAFKMDCTVEEACAFAGISADQYRYFREQHPNFSRVKDACKQLIFLRARQCIYRHVDKDYDSAIDFMERKKKSEYSKRTEHSGPDGGPIEHRQLDDREVGRIKGLLDGEGEPLTVTEENASEVLGAAKEALGEGMPKIYEGVVVPEEDKSLEEEVFETNDATQDTEIDVHVRSISEFEELVTEPSNENQEQSQGEGDS
jgi:hypothetical protein